VGPKSNRAAHAPLIREPTHEATREASAPLWSSYISAAAGQGKRTANALCALTRIAAQPQPAAGVEIDVQRRFKMAL
jgi:hypothetical protein